MNQSKLQLRETITALRVRLETARLKELHLLSEIIDARGSVDCYSCANRGLVKDLTHETYCNHCIWQERWRVNHYKAKLVE